VAVRRVDFGVANVWPSSSALTISRERAGEKRQSEVNDTTRNLAVAFASAADRLPPCLSRRIEIVERLGHQQVGVGIEVAGELVALVAQVGLDLELDVEAELDSTPRAFAAELLGHAVVREVGDVAEHARQSQAAPRHDAVLVVVPPWKSGSVRMAWRATSLKAMFCAVSFGAAAITSAWRMRSG
jgi:hypothetical protein